MVRTRNTSREETQGDGSDSAAAGSAPESIVGSVPDVGLPDCETEMREESNLAPAAVEEIAEMPLAMVRSENEEALVRTLGKIEDTSGVLVDITMKQNDSVMELSNTIGALQSSPLVCNSRQRQPGHDDKASQAITDQPDRNMEPEKPGPTQHPTTMREMGRNEARGVHNEYSVYPTHVAFKIYQQGLIGFRCKRVGDGSFFLAKRTWERLLKDFPIMESSRMRLILQAFEGDARHVFEEIANSDPDMDSAELWTRLEKRLCNSVYQSALRDKFFSISWCDKRESFDKCASRLRSAALTIPDAIEEGIMLNRLKAGLPTRLQDQASLVPGGFDEVVSRLSCLSTAQMVKGEHVREVNEPKMGGGWYKARGASPPIGGLHDEVI